MIDKQNYLTYTGNTSDNNDKTVENLHKQVIIDGVDVSGCRCLAYPELDNPMCNGLYLGCQKNNCDYKKWKRKEQELQETMDNYVKLDNQRVKEYNELVDKYKTKEQECERLKRGYAELTEIVSPYMDDFTGYNEELGGFDIVLCVKELMEQIYQLKKSVRY